MGRPRGFDERDVLTRAAWTFDRWGYAGTSVDDLVTAAQLQRGSLYAAFGSKRGLFLAALEHALAADPALAIDLVLIGLLELAPSDDEARGRMAAALTRLGGGATPQALGRRLVERAGIEDHPNGTAVDLRTEEEGRA